tara:strand:+ start:1637 stop:1993 length:357 start_codon:yes stop_codon:yes gene_type:complete
MRFIFLIFSCFALSACQQTSSEQQALLRLQASAVACQKQTNKTAQCESIEKKYEWTSQALLLLQSSPQGFGHTVLTLQTRISKLKEQTLTPLLSRKLAQLQTELDGYITLIALFESPQ